jgi:hypothetical protein
MAVHDDAGRVVAAQFRGYMASLLYFSPSAGSLTFDNIVSFHKEISDYDLAKLAKDEKDGPQQYRLNLLRMFYHYRAADGKIGGAPVNFTDYFTSVTSSYPHFINVTNTAKCYFGNYNHSATDFSYYAENGSQAIMRCQLKVDLLRNGI